MSKIILLDNGHGINTPGKCSPNKSLMEWKYTREIANKVYSKLKEEGYTSYKIKQEGNFISQATLTAIKSGKGGLDHRTIDKICAKFDCQPNDIMEYVKDPTEEE